MPKRDRPDPLGHWPSDVQEKHRPDRPQEPTSPEAPSTGEPAGLKRDRQEQINVLVPRGLRTPFRVKAMQEGRTMSDLVTEWIREYLNDQKR